MQENKEIFWRRFKSEFKREKKTPWKEKTREHPSESVCYQSRIV